MSEQQAVVDETRVAATPATGVDNAREDVDPLDQLLAEYDQGTKKPDPVTPPENKPTPLPDDVVQTVRFLESEVRESRREKDERAISETVASIRGDVPTDVYDDDMIRGWLEVQAVKDPRLAEAFKQKNQNPRGWERVKGELRKALAKKAGSQIDRGATDDRAAMTAAIRGASTRASADPPPNLGRMTDAELRKHTQDNYGF